MELSIKDKLYEVCLYYGLGKVMEEPLKVEGGLMHSMFKVTTDCGTYAIKCLNPVIMNRIYALPHIINSEKISEIMGLHIPAVIAKTIDTNQVHRYQNQYYMFFDWTDGKSIYPPDITVEHCKVIGDILGKIHSFDITVEGVEDEAVSTAIYPWKEYLEIAKKNRATWTLIYEESLEDIIAWNQKSLKANDILSKEKVISHRDLDPKNVLWQGDCPYIIDWESAGYVNPYQELLEVLNYWADDGNGGLHQDLFMAIIHSYELNKSLKGVNWEVVLDSGYEGMLGWLEYNIKRALGIETSSKEESALGEQQVVNTISELKRYQEKRKFIKEWLNAYF